MSYVSSDTLSVYLMDAEIKYEMLRKNYEITAAKRLTETVRVEQVYESTSIDTIENVNV